MAILRHPSAAANLLYVFFKSYFLNILRDKRYFETCVRDIDLDNFAENEIGHHIHKRY